MKKILIIQYSPDFNGSSLSALSLTKGLIATGYDVTVAFAFDGPIINEYRQLGVKIIFAYHLSWLRRTTIPKFIYDLFREIKRVRWLRLLLKQMQPDLIYINTAVSLPAALAAKSENMPCVWHIRELFYDVGGELVAPRIFLPLIKLVFPTLASTIVVNSDAIRKNIISHIIRMKVQIVPIGIANEYFYNNGGKLKNLIREDMRNKMIIGVPGTLRPLKGHLFFLQAVAPLLKRENDLVVLITGDGTTDLKDRIIRIIQDLKIEAQIRLLGSINNMPEFYHTCDIVCVPSSSESFGRTVIEAMACEKPVLASAVGGITEIVDDRVNGLLFELGNETALRNGLVELLEDRVLRERLAQSARIKAWEHYREEVYQQRLIAIIEETLAAA